MLKVFKTHQELFETAAQLIISTAQKAIETKGQFSIALTGGSSPVGLYQLLASPDYANQIDWSKVYVFWGDERWVPLDDDRSNTKMSFETLLNHVAIPRENIFPMYKDDVTPEQYAHEYEQLLRKTIGNDGVIDLILLGMGDDGHTASLFPGTAVLSEQSKWVDAYFLEPQEMYRITLTAPLLNNADKIVVITFGEKKATALHEVLYGTYNPEQYPSQLLKPKHGELIFLTDEAAATKQ